MSGIMELGTYSSFSTITHELREVKEQLRMMEDSNKILHATVADLQNKISSTGQDNRGFVPQNEPSPQECHVVNISLG